MRVVIDTHVLLWALLDPQRLSPRERELIDDNEVLVSAASIWEIGIKHAIGRLDCDPRQILETLNPRGSRISGSPACTRSWQLPCPACTAIRSTAC